MPVVPAVALWRGLSRRAGSRRRRAAPLATSAAALARRLAYARPRVAPPKLVQGRSEAAGGNAGTLLGEPRARAAAVATATTVTVTVWPKL
jgi:hypothetical protein